MILKYGNYAHAVGEATIVISSAALFNERRIHYANRERWEISGFVQAATPASLTNVINQIKSAYSVPNQDLALYLSDGVTLSSHFIRSTDTASGVRVVSGPNFPEGRGAEYCTFRHYRIVLEAELLLVDPTNPDPDSALLAWEETLTLVGGGPKFVYLQPLNGLPLKQFVSAASTYHAMQSGRAVGQFSYPEPSAPLWPFAEHLEARKSSRHTPRQVYSTGTMTEYETTWQYSFEAEAPLIGNPTLR